MNLFPRSVINAWCSGVAGKKEVTAHLTTRKERGMSAIHKRSVSIIFISVIFAIASINPARCEDVQVKVEFYPNNVTTGTPVIMLLQGKTYPVGGWFDEMEKSGKYEADEKFVIDFLRNNQRGELDKIVDMWLHDDRAEIKAKLSDPTNMALNVVTQSKMKENTFLAKIAYGDYRIFIVQQYLEGYGHIKDSYPVLKKDGRFYITNNLLNDPVFTYLSNKYMSMLSRKRR